MDQHAAQDEHVLPPGEQFHNKSSQELQQKFTFVVYDGESKEMQLTEYTISSELFVTENKIAQLCREF